MMQTRKVVAIGGSLGSVDGVTELLRELPADMLASIFVVLHIGARGNNLLAEGFNSRTALTVSTAEDSQTPQPGHVYIAPSDHHLLIIDDKMRLGRGPRENLSRPAIDPLLRSVGACYGPRAIGVVLSGLLDDGAAGLADLKRCGGIAVVQNPRDARASDMPLGALAATDVDYRASIADMPALLMRLIGEPAAAAPPVPNDIALEVQIALGRGTEVGTATIMKLGDPAPFTCPSCGGVLSEMRSNPPLRFRCQVGHAFTAQTLLSDKEGSVDEAMRMALRVLEERAQLTQRMSDEAHHSGRPAAARMFASAADQSRKSANVLRDAVIEGEASPRVGQHTFASD